MNILFGKSSNLTESLSKVLPNSRILSSRNFLFEPNRYIKYFQKNHNIIINHSYPLINQSGKVNYSDALEYTLQPLIKLLSFTNDKTKLIVMSSSSAVNNINLLSDSNSSRDIYSILKLLSERLIIEECINKKIRYINARITNIFGGTDNFSLINRLLRNEKKKIYLNNYGNSVRNFIHVDEVSLIYKKLINSKISGNIDIGSPNYYLIGDIVKSIGFKGVILKGFKNEQLFQKINENFILNFYKFNKRYSLKNFLNKELRKNLILNTFQPINKNQIDLVIYGVGNALRQIVGKSNKIYGKEISFYVDDNSKIHGKKFNGLPVFSFEQLQHLSKFFKIDQILLTISALKAHKKVTLYKKLTKLTKNLKVLPSKNEIYKNKIHISDLYNGDFDILFAKKNFFINSRIYNKYTNKKILVTGGAGSIGSEISKIISRNDGASVYILDHDEYGLYKIKNYFTGKKNIKYILGSIDNYSFLLKTINKYKFDYIYHAAAYKHLNIVEKNLHSAVINNIFGTYYLFDICKNKNINITFISTDKSDHPSSVLGFTKRIGEIIANSYRYKTLNNVSIVRFGNVFSSKGSAVPLFLKQIKENKPITITNLKVERFFMSISMACYLVLQCSQMKNNFQSIYSLDMGKPYKIIDIINKLGEVYSNEKLQIIETGLKKGEKIRESIYKGKKLIISEKKGIKYFKDNKYDFEKITNKLNYIIKNLKDLSNNDIYEFLINFEREIS